MSIKVLQKILDLAQEFGRSGGSDCPDLAKAPPHLALPPLDLPPTPDLAKKLEAMGLSTQLADRLQSVFSKHVRVFGSSVLEAYLRQGPALLASLSGIDQVLKRASDESNSLLERLAEACVQRFLMGMECLQNQLESRVASGILTFKKPKSACGFSKVSLRFSRPPRPCVADLPVLPRSRLPSRPFVASTSSTLTPTQPRFAPSLNASRWTTSRSASGCVLEPLLSCSGLPRAVKADSASTRR